MKIDKKFILICLFVLMFSIATASAVELNNQTDTAEVQSTEVIGLADDASNVTVADDQSAADVKVSDSDVQSVVDVKASDEKDDVLAAPAEREVLGATINDLTNLINVNTERINLNGNYLDGTTASLTTSNHIIDGHDGTWGRTTSSGRILNVANGVHDITFQNIIFQGGKTIGAGEAGGTQDHGAAVRFQGTSSNIKFINCSFISNSNIPDGVHEHSAGGAIAFDNSITNLNISGCIFKDNQVLANNHRWADGSAIFFYYFNGGSANNIVIENCVFEDNVAKATLSSATYAMASHGTVCFDCPVKDIQIINTVFEGNTVSATGRANSVGGNTYITTAYGGAIYFGNTVSGEVNFINSSFIENNVYVTCTNNIKAADAAGGAIFFANTPNNINFENCTLEKNSVNYGSNSNANDGAIHFGNHGIMRYSSATGDDARIVYEGTPITSISGLTFKDTTFSANSAQTAYPAISFIVPVSNFEFNNVTFKDHTGVNAPLYFASSISSTDIINSTFTNNENSASNGYGGAIYVAGAVGSSGQVNIVNTTFNNVRANGGLGGAIYFANTVNNLHFKGSNFTNNKNGGSLYFRSSLDSSSFDKCFFYDNSANIASAIYVSGTTSATNFINSIFKQNVNSVGSGGAILFNTLNTPTFNNCTFDSNKADSNTGGAIYI